MATKKRLCAYANGTERHLFYLWCDLTKEQIEGVEGVTEVYPGTSASFSVHYDPRYDEAEIKEELQMLEAYQMRDVVDDGGRAASEANEWVFVSYSYSDKKWLYRWAADRLGLEIKIVDVPSCPGGRRKIKIYRRTGVLMQFQESRLRLECKRLLSKYGEKEFDPCL